MDSPKNLIAVLYGGYLYLEEKVAETYVKFLEQCLAHNKYLISIS